MLFINSCELDSVVPFTPALLKLGWESKAPQCILCVIQLIVDAEDKWILMDLSQDSVSLSAILTVGTAENLLLLLNLKSHFAQALPLQMLKLNIYLH